MQAYLELASKKYMYMHVHEKTETKYKDVLAAPDYLHTYRIFDEIPRLLPRLKHIPEE